MSRRRCWGLSMCRRVYVCVLWGSRGEEWPALLLLFDEVVVVVVVLE